jgi:hypothetical protein
MAADPVLDFARRGMRAQAAVDAIVEAAIYDALEPGDGIIVKAWAHGHRVGIVSRRGRDGHLHAWKEHLDQATLPELAAAIARNGDPRP